MGINQRWQRKIKQSITTEKFMPEKRKELVRLLHVCEPELRSNPDRRVNACFLSHRARNFFDENLALFAYYSDQIRSVLGGFNYPPVKINLANLDRRGDFLTSAGCLSVTYKCSFPFFYD